MDIKKERRPNIEICGIPAETPDPIGGLNVSIFQTLVCFLPHNKIDWRSISIENVRNQIYASCRISPEIGKRKRGRYFFHIFPYFSSRGTAFARFQKLGNTPLLKRF